MVHLDAQAALAEDTRELVGTFPDSGPEDVERAVAQVEGVRPGNVIAFGVEGRRGREAVVVVAETKAAETTSVRDDVARKVRHAIGLPPGDVVLVPPGTLPKTSSGKLQRSLCRRRYLESELSVLGSSA